jgi:hypothetical protein
MTKKEHALKISEMWLRIAESETPLGFWFWEPWRGEWGAVEDTPDKLSDLSRWKVGPIDRSVQSKTILPSNAAYFASLWKQVSEGATFERWDPNDFSWDKVDRVPSSYDYPALWRAVKNSPKPKPSVVYVWKRTDTGELTDDLIEAAYWEKRNYPIQRFVSEEQA